MLNHTRRSTYRSDQSYALRSRERGQVIIGSLLLFLTIAITVLVGIATPVAIQVRSAVDFFQSKQGYIAADVLNEEALYRLNKGKTLPANLVLSFNGATSTAVISTVGTEMQVIATGISGMFSRFSKSLFAQTQSQGIKVTYGVQTGSGGISLSGSPTINGSVTTNGNITCSGVCVVTGSATAATTAPQTPDQSNGSGTPAVDSLFGNSNTTQDFAESFTVSTTTPIARVMLYIKKVGSPANFTVTIASNSSGSPSRTTLASAVLNATQVTSAYAWVPVIFTSGTSFTPGTTYWLVGDAVTNTSNYYVLGTSNNNAYSGSLKFGTYSSGTWLASTATYDAFFQLYLGSISSITGITAQGDASAYAVFNSTVSGNLYCQGGTGNNKSCNSASSTPTTTTFPFSTSDISNWEAQAVAGGTYTGTMTIGGTTATTTGPLKIVGDLNIGASAVVTFAGPVYVTGNINLSGSAQVKLASSLGSNSAVIIADGTVSVGGSAGVAGSGTSGSYMLLLSTSCGGATGCSNTTPAITISGAAGALAALAPNGKIYITGSGSLAAAAANMLMMDGGTSLTYQNALSNIVLGGSSASSSGSTSAWVTDTWQEITQ